MERFGAGTPFSVARRTGFVTPSGRPWPGGTSPVGNVVGTPSPSAAVPSSSVSFQTPIPLHNVQPAALSLSALQAQATPGTPGATSLGTHAQPMMTSVLSEYRNEIARLRAMIDAQAAAHRGEMEELRQAASELAKMHERQLKARDEELAHLRAGNRDAADVRSHVDAMEARLAEVTRAKVVAEQRAAHLASLLQAAMASEEAAGWMGQQPPRDNTGESSAAFGLPSGFAASGRQPAAFVGGMSTPTAAPAAAAAATAVAAAPSSAQTEVLRLRLELQQAQRAVEHERALAAGAARQHAQMVSHLRAQIAHCERQLRLETQQHSEALEAMQAQHQQALRGALELASRGAADTADGDRDPVVVRLRAALAEQTALAQARQDELVQLRARLDSGAAEVALSTEQHVQQVRSDLERQVAQERERAERLEAELSRARVDKATAALEAQRRDDSATDELRRLQQAATAKIRALQEQLDVVRRENQLLRRRLERGD